MSTYSIHPLCAASPDMPAAQFAEFRDDIRTNGLREPVKLWRGQVIDGRHRLRACQELGLEPVVETIEMDESALPAYVLSLNAMRNHLTPSARAMYAAEIANLKHGSNQFEKKVEVGTSTSSSPITIRQAAKAVGVHHTAVLQARRLEREAAPEVVEAVRRGHLTLHAAQKITTAAPKAEQPAVLERVLAENQGKKRQTVRPIAGGGVGKTPRKNEPIESRLDRHLMQIDVAIEAIAQYKDRGIPHHEMRTEWLSTVERALSVLRSLRHQLKTPAA